MGRKLTESPEILRTLGIAISRRKKVCPSENVYQEFFYGRFKKYLGDPNRFYSLGD